MTKLVLDGGFGAVTVAVGVALMLYGGTPLAFWGGLWACLAGGYVVFGVFEVGEEPKPGVTGSDEPRRT